MSRQISAMKHSATIDMHIHATIDSLDFSSRHTANTVGETSFMSLHDIFLFE